MSPPEPTPSRLDDAETRFAQAALRRGILEPEALQNAIARVRNLRGRGIRIGLPEALDEEDDVPTLEIKALRKALRPARVKPRIRGYRLLALAGRGGLGTVYKARQISMGRIVALKVLPKVLVESRRDLDRFLREARLAANLNHSNIVRIFEVGRVKDLYFISMEYVPGETLSSRVKVHGVLPLGRALALARDVASGLDHAHGKNVIHRDLKPGNVMLRPDGPVKIVDLGLARGMTSVPSQKITEIGVLVGTPEFMAPEQARDPTSVDGRSDIYALGATLHFALTGRPPVEGRTTLEVLARLFGAERVPLAELRPDLPEEVHAFIEQAMAHDPDERFADAGEVREALDVIMDSLEEGERSWHEKIDDTRVTLLEGPREAAPPRLHPWWILALLVLAGTAAGLLILAGVLTTGGPEPSPPPQTEEAWEEESNTPLAVERDTRAKRLLEKAVEYVEANPADRVGAIRRLEEVIERYPGTLAAFQARDAARELRDEGAEAGD
ncbi:MAG: serine/threonine-protein kinase [Planctomycetota bacterium]|jgi:serine/threonine protein kinase